jgi:hypothetical protein
MRQPLFFVLAFLTCFLLSCGKTQVSKFSRPAVSSAKTEATVATAVPLTDGTFPITDAPSDPTNVGNFFDSLTWIAYKLATPVQKPHLPAKYFFLTYVYAARVQNTLNNGAGNFTFNISCNDTARYPFWPYIASSASGVSRATIGSISDFSTFNAPTNVSVGGTFNVNASFTVTYFLNGVQNTDFYEISGIMGQAPSLALSQAIYNTYNNLFTRYVPGGGQP